MRNRLQAMPRCSNSTPAICCGFLALLLTNFVTVHASQYGTAQVQQGSFLVFPWPFSKLWPPTPPQQRDTDAAAAAGATAAAARAAAAAATTTTTTVPSTSARSKKLLPAHPKTSVSVKSLPTTGSNAYGVPQKTAAAAPTPSPQPASKIGVSKAATTGSLPASSKSAAVAAATSTAAATATRTAVQEPDYDLSQVLPSVVLRPGPAAAVKELKLGCLLPLGPGSTPEDKSVGEAVLAAMKMAINDELPRLLPGFYANLTCYNTQCSGLAAAAGVYYFANNDIDAAVGDVCSTSSLAAAAAAKLKRVLVVSPAATSPSLSMKDTFSRTVPSDIYQAFAASKLMFEDFGATRVGLIFESNTYGIGLADNLAAADDNSTELVYEFAPGRGDAKQAVAAAVAAQQDMVQPIDAVFLAMNDVAFAADFLKQAAAQKLDLLLFGGDTLTSPALLDMVKGHPSAIANLTSMSVNPGRVTFIEKFAKAAPGVKFEPYAAPAYDATVAVLKAYETTDAPRDGAKLAEKINGMVFEGVSGPVQFDMFGDVVVHSESYVYGQFNLTTNKFMLTGFAS